MKVRAAIDWTVHRLAQALRGIHWMIGITTIPSDATPRQERSFVLMWLGLIIFIVLWLAVLLYLL